MRIHISIPSAQLNPKIALQTVRDAMGRPMIQSAPRMNLFVIIYAVLAILLFTAQVVFAQEPSYCSPHRFINELQISHPSGDAGLHRLKAFRLGKVVLSGLAVGSTDARALEKYARDYTSMVHPAPGRSSLEQQRFCTWYVNRGNRAAESAFNHHYVPAPLFVIPGSMSAVLYDAFLNPWDPYSQDGIIESYIQSLGSAFNNGWDSFLTCAEDFGFIALGCNGQKQRGPTVFGALLAFSGCSPEHATEIVNSVWNYDVVNGIGSTIQPEVRFEIIRAFYQLGDKRKDVRARLQAAFGETKR